MMRVLRAKQTGRASRPTSPTARKLRKETTISLNEAKRRAERDEARSQEARERHPELFSASADKTPGKDQTAANGKTPRVMPDQPGSPKRVDINAQDPTGTVANQQPKDPKKVASDTPSGKPDEAAVRTDDGLQADERSLQTDLAAEKARKKEKDVVLNEASHILADEVDLIHSDTKLAQVVLPHQALEKNSVN